MNAAVEDALRKRIWIGLNLYDPNTADCACPSCLPVDRWIDRWFGKFPDGASAGPSGYPKCLIGDVMKNPSDYTGVRWSTDPNSDFVPLVITE